MTKYEIVTITIQGVSALLIGGGLLYTAKQLKANHDWNRRKTAQEATRQYHSIRNKNIVNDKLHYLTRTDQIPLDEINGLCEEFQELRQSIHALLNYFESIARGVNQGIYDEEVIKEASESIMIRAFDKFYPYIQKRREKQPTAWIQLETITAKWKYEKQPAYTRKHTG